MIDTIENQVHRVGEIDKFVSVTSTVSTAVCEPEIFYTMTSSPASALISIDDYTRTIMIATTSELNEVGIFTVTITATIGPWKQDSKSFVVTVYDCSSLTIDSALFTSQEITYTVGTI